MKPLLAALIGMTLTCTMQAQEPSATVIDITRERARIREQRTENDSTYSMGMAVCYKRFAVFDCQQEVKRTRRMAMDELRRQEVVLNDMERRANAAATVNRFNQRLASERILDHEVKRQLSVQSDEEHRQRVIQTLRDPTSEAAPRVKVELPRVVPQNRVLPKEANQESRYLNKLQEADQHKHDKAKTLSEKGAGLAAPLPIPPGL